MPIQSPDSNTVKKDGKNIPDFEVPPLACDTHFHVFGLPEKFPAALGKN